MEVRVASGLSTLNRTYRRDKNWQTDTLTRGEKKTASNVEQIIPGNNNNTKGEN